MSESLARNPPPQSRWRSRPRHRHFRLSAHRQTASAQRRMRSWAHSGTRALPLALLRSQGLSSDCSVGCTATTRAHQRGRTCRRRTLQAWMVHRTPRHKRRKGQCLLKRHLARSSVHLQQEGLRQRNAIVSHSHQSRHCQLRPRQQSRRSRYNGRARGSVLVAPSRTTSGVGRSMIDDAGFSYPRCFHTCITARSIYVVRSPGGGVWVALARTLAPLPPCTCAPVSARVFGPTMALKVKPL